MPRTSERATHISPCARRLPFHVGIRLLTPAGRSRRHRPRGDSTHEGHSMCRFGSPVWRLSRAGTALGPTPPIPSSPSGFARGSPFRVQIRKPGRAAFSRSLRYRADPTHPELPFRFCTWKPLWCAISETRSGGFLALAPPSGRPHPSRAPRTSLHVGHVSTCRIAHPSRADLLWATARPDSLRARGRAGRRGVILPPTHLPDPDSLPADLGP